MVIRAKRPVPVSLLVAIPLLHLDSIETVSSVILLVKSLVPEMSMGAIFFKISIIDAVTFVATILLGQLLGQLQDNWRAETTSALPSCPEEQIEEEITGAQDRGEETWRGGKMRK